MTTRAKLTVVDSIDRADAVSAYLEARLYEFNAAATGRADGMGLCFTVEDGRRIVAGVAGFSWAGFAQVRELWVDEAYRGQRLGTELMAAAEQEAVRRGCVQLQVSTYSFPAPEFYRRLGFADVARVPGHRQNYDSIHLVKQLR
jgi:ribosomal protein S18 acetylase RimI-like enzyme